MKIAFDSQIFCQQPYGGISRYFTSLAKQVDSGNDDVRIFAPLHVNRYIRGLPGHLSRGFRLNRVVRGAGRPLLMYNLLASRSMIKAWDPDIVHETYYTRFRVAPRRCPVVVTVYDMIHEIFPEFFAPDDKTHLLKRASILRADHVVCISESTRRDLLEVIDVDPAKVSVVHLGFEPMKEHDDSHPAVDEESPFLLYVGARSGYKNFEGMLRGVATSKQLRDDMRIVAFGGGAFDNDELRLIGSLGFDCGRVKQVSGDDALLANYYRAAAAFVYPSLYEGFGLPPLEAMAHDCPVVCSDSSSIPEVVGPAGEYFDPRDGEAIGNAISNAVCDAARREELIRSGRERLGSFEWSECARKTRAIYADLVGTS